MLERLLAKWNGAAVPPTPTPLPPPLYSLWDVFKIVVFVMVWYITTDANKALVAAVDYGRLVGNLGGNIDVLPYASWLGAKVGIMQGAIMTAKALVTIWAGPTILTYLGPVIMAGFRAPIELVLEFRQAWNAKPRDKKDDGTDKDPKDPKAPL